MQTVLNVRGLFWTSGSGHNREVVALYRWSLEQVPLYTHAKSYAHSDGMLRQRAKYVLYEL